MVTIFQISTTEYSNDIPLIKKAMINLESLCEIKNGYNLSKPVSKFGWTFFELALNQGLLHSIEQKFSDMIQKYKEKNPEEKLIHFISDYFESNGCKLKLKIVNS